MKCIDKQVKETRKARSDRILNTENGRRLRVRIIESKKVYNRSRESSGFYFYIRFAEENSLTLIHR